MIKLLPSLLVLLITFEAISCSRGLLRDILAKDRAQTQKANVVLQHLQDAMEEADRTEIVDNIIKKLGRYNILPSSLAELRHQLGSERGTGPVLRHPQLRKLTDTGLKFGSDLSLTRLQELFNGEHR